MLHAIKKKRLILLGVSGVLLFFLIFFVRLFHYDESEIQSVDSKTLLEGKEEETLPKEQSIIFVDVKGAVGKEGVYEIESGKRVKDVIELAGGFAESADTNQINLALLLEDEMVVYVPVLGESTIIQVNNGTEQGKVLINSATLEELQTLPGIGPAKAAAIIAYREENGPFQKVEDLLLVSGIGEKSLEKIKEGILIK